MRNRLAAFLQVLALCTPYTRCNCKNWQFPGAFTYETLVAPLQRAPSETSLLLHVKRLLLQLLQHLLQPRGHAISLYCATRAARDRLLIRQL
jgi:hypothetical protein